MRTIAFCAALLLATSLVTAGPIYTGSLTSADGNLVGTGAWVDPSILKAKDQDGWLPISLTYTVSQNEDLTWHYEYTASAAASGFSHMIVQTSDTFTLQDLLAHDGSVELKLNTLNQGNWNLPADIYGLKVPLSGTSNATIAFDSTRAPMWGNIYFKGGKTGQVENSAWNSAFLQDKAGTPISQHLPGAVLVPDTATNVPEPATALLLVVGGIFVLHRRHVRRTRA